MAKTSRRKSIKHKMKRLQKKKRMLRRKNKK